MPRTPQLLAFYCQPGTMPHDATISQLHLPSAGILVTAVMGLIAGLDLMSMHAGFWFRDRDAAMHDIPSGSAFNVGLLLTNASLFHIYGAICMRRGVRYRIAMTSAIAACIPFLSPMVYFGIPFGIWALIVLRREDVRTAFGVGASTQY